ncbi:hypothetical protein IA57_06740 [Mangrovimonas yunxiaonensis]|uniref:Rieske domain-containing protein n=1 Tax=Mangrovimonas yunxiaonensis TaxID=1197477 RepID=A0A084TLD5_9FLAO|nr:hypothetical protein [Mangrovimonas yunxiaonensis]KFB01521.1 hypothetical protein IA57_06740 [Mangrovimonas yunxiaonensis]MBR9758346.1 hypothetical protein [Algicola sp.]GGH36202.1 hypothetical protein GCM10011364_03290 [Mangrovimonas yunxiaonensis]
MKHPLYFSLLALFLMASCNKNDDDHNNNQYLPNVAFDTGTLINTNLPQFNALNFPNNPVAINNAAYGINGIVVMNTGSGFTAFELSDPNHALQTCSKLNLEGIIVSCLCDDGNAYDVLTGQGQEGTTGPYGLRPYFVEVSGNIIRVYNN